VGVVGEVRRDGRLDQPAPQVYLAANQTADLTLPPYARPSSFAVRTYGDAKQLTGSVQRAVWTIDPEQPISGIQTLEEKLSGRVADRRFSMVLLSSFAALAVMLALIGCYGVVSYAALQRTREIGIRLAFGAPRRQVIGLVVKSGLGWSVTGVAVGLVAALGLTRVMKGLLFEIAPSDPLTFATTAMSIVAVSVVASYLPARRAASIDPISALRVE
jgi:ABC-type antimicrobial peptide transport system permease subunit